MPEKPPGIQELIDKNRHLLGKQALVRESYREVKRAQKTTYRDGNELVTASPHVLCSELSKMLYEVGIKNVFFSYLPASDKIKLDSIERTEWEGTPAQYVLQLSVPVTKEEYEKAIGKPISASVSPADPGKTSG